MAKKKTKKRNPNDGTLRNVNASNKKHTANKVRDSALKIRVRALEKELENLTMRLRVMEDVVAVLCWKAESEYCGRVNDTRSK